MPRNRIEEIDEVSIERVHQMLGDGPYWHDRIRRVLTVAGFAVRRLERQEPHPIWEVYLTRISFGLAADKTVASNQIRTVLVDGGLRVVRNEFNIVSRSGDALRCVFLLNLGTPGVWQRPVPLRQAELLPLPRRNRLQRLR